MQTWKKIEYSLIGIAALSLLGLTAWAQTLPANLSTDPMVNEPLHADLSQSLRDMPRASVPVQTGVHTPLKPHATRFKQPVAGAQAELSSTFQPLIGSTIAAGIGLNFDGIDQSTELTTGPDALDCPSVSGFVVDPPDTNAAIGDTQIVEWVNLCYAVFDKATGALIAGPFAGNQFWQGFGGTCELHNDGDPIIQWDKLAHRWVAFQNVFEPPYSTCVAISTTPDATGPYYRFAYPQVWGFPDYPKVGIMPDAYYQTQNSFTLSGFTFSFVGVAMCAYDRVSMLAGNLKAQQICFIDSGFGRQTDDSLLPADLDSPAHPPVAGQPEVFLGSIDQACKGSAVYEYLMWVNFRSPKKSKIAGVNLAMPLAVPQFGICNELRLGIQEPTFEGSPGVDSLGDRLMYRLAYSSNGITQNWVVTHSIDNPSCNGANPFTCGTAVRWYQFAAPQGSTSLSLTQAGQTPDDGESRWMASAAMDKAGNIAIGYSRTSPTIGDYPSIYYAGQAAGEPAGTTDAESLIYPGLYEAFGPLRWGDYTSMGLDGDGCTFVYANQYLPSTDIELTHGDGFAWRTRLATLKFPSCQ
jgi:hypothetical protein